MNNRSPTLNNILQCRPMLNYSKSGVDIAAGNKLVGLLKNKLPHIGGFAGLYPLGNQYLVASADGVGTKLKLAISQKKYHTIGIDLVAMCVNDVITTGADPLFFLDYYATSKLDIAQAEEVISGIAAGCREAGIILLGGETAEMPGFYQPGDFDLSGFSVGIVDKNQLIDGKKIKEGDSIIGFASSGVHSNGFSLVHKILEIDPVPPFDLLTPTKIYTKEIERLKSCAAVKGMAHITGGGLLENIPRILPEGLGAVIQASAWKTPEIFSWMQEAGNLNLNEMYRVFNMGIGMIAIVSSDAVDSIQDGIVIGSIHQGEGVDLK